MRTFAAERGGNLPALGYQAPTGFVETGPYSVANAQLAAMLAAHAPQAAIDKFVLENFQLTPGGGGRGGGNVGPLNPLSGIVGGAGVAALGPEAGSAGLGALGGPLGILGSDLSTLLESAIGGRARTAASQATMSVLLQSNDPAVRKVGQAISRVLRAGLVTSSPAAAAIIRPALAAAIQSLTNQGYAPRQIRQLFSAAFRGQSAQINQQSGVFSAAPAVAAAAGDRYAGRPVHDLRSIGPVSQSEANALPSPYAAPVLAAIADQGVAGGQGALATIAPSQLPGWVAPLVKAFSIEQAGSAAYRLLHDEPLTPEQFGSLAGVVIGGLAGDPAAGAQIGLEAGAAVAQLDSLAHTLTGQTLDQLLSAAGRASLAHLRNLITRQASPAVPPAPAARQIVNQPAPAPEPPAARQIVNQPRQPAGTQAHQGTLAEQQQQIQQLMARQGGQPVTEPLTREITAQPNNPPGHGTLLNHQPGGCYSEQQISELLDCPNFQKQLQEKFTVRPPQGGNPGQIVPKVPICVCCDSAADLILFAQSNGLSGNCVQTVASPAELIGLKGSA